MAASRVAFTEAAPLAFVYVRFALMTAIAFTFLMPALSLRRSPHAMCDDMLEYVVS